MTSQDVTARRCTEEAMKQIEAVIHQFKLQEVRNALEEMGIDDFMESDIQCHQKGQTMIFRGASFMANIVEKVKLEIIAADDSVAKIIEAIGAITNTGRKEDCRFAIRPYLEVT
jgi:nitrogen regulatory protein PII